MKYRRAYQPGGTYFFTVVTCNRRPILTSSQSICRLKQAFTTVRKKHPFIIDAIVILPDHLHTIWHLPEGDADYSTRWNLIKRYFSIARDTGRITRSGHRKREKGIWQRRFWEHAIRNHHDWQRHVDYIHFNPVKHGYVNSPSEWKYSSFSIAVRNGRYDRDWGEQEPHTIRNLCLE